jgi:hypothetical protein
MNNILYLKEYDYYINNLYLLDHKKDIMWYFDRNYFFETYKGLNKKIIEYKTIEKINIDFFKKTNYQEFYINDFQKKIILNMTREETLNYNTKLLLHKINAIEYFI